MPIPSDEWRPMLGKRIGKAWLSALSILEGSGDDFVDFADLIPVMCEAGEIKETTAANILHRAVAARIVERRGRYDFRTHRGRIVRLIHPVPDEWKYWPEGKSNGASPSKKIKRFEDPSTWSIEDIEKAMDEGQILYPPKEGAEYIGLAKAGTRPAWKFR